MKVNSTLLAIFLSLIIGFSNTLTTNDYHNEVNAQTPELLELALHAEGSEEVVEIEITSSSKTKSFFRAFSLMIPARMNIELEAGGEYISVGYMHRKYQIDDTEYTKISDVREHIREWLLEVTGSGGE